MRAIPPLFLKDGLAYRVDPVLRSCPQCPSRPRLGILSGLHTESMGRSEVSGRPESVALPHPESVSRVSERLPEARNFSLLPCFSVDPVPGLSRGNGYGIPSSLSFEAESGSFRVRATAAQARSGLPLQGRGA